MPWISLEIVIATESVGPFILEHCFPFHFFYLIGTYVMVLFYLLIQIFYELRTKKLLVTW